MRQTTNDRGGEQSRPRGLEHASAPSSGRSGRRKPARGERGGRAGEAAGELRLDRPADLYAEVTARIVAELEAGRLPWVQPWGEAGAPVPGLPRNAVTGRAYSGINVVILWAAVIARGWSSQDWLTYRQAQAAGGQVRKGERGTTVVFADRFTPKGGEPQEAGDGASDPPGAQADRRFIPFLKRFTVFNIAQVDGLAASLAPAPEPLGPREAVAAGEQLMNASGVAIRIGGTHAFYSPRLDVVQLPPQQAFFEQINFYRTALHELVHATGHPSRLGRDQSGPFGSNAYAREELVAELGSAFLCASLGIRPTVRHADYLGGWLDLLRADARAIFRAAGAASRAADWLLARGPAADPAAGAPEYVR